jgi:phosphoglycerate dehydrogenase-like enzyme
LQQASPYPAGARYGADALRRGTIAGAGLDVCSPEPLPGDHALAGMPNVTLFPHIGSATWSTREAMADLAVQNVLGALCEDQEMPHSVS